MLCYKYLSLQNPLKPELAAINAKALVVSNDLTMVLPSTLAQQLQLGMDGTRPVMLHTGLQALPYVGPLKISLEGQVAYSGAIISGDEVILGASVARELGLADLIEQPGAGEPAKSAPVSEAPRPMALSERKGVTDIMRKEGFIDLNMCRTIIDYANSRQRKRLDIVDYDRNNPQVLKRKINIAARDTFLVPVDDIVDLLRSIFFDVYKAVESFYDLKLEWWERPQLLYYPVGGQYGIHSDSDEPITMPEGGHKWQRAHDRDISVLLYLNEDFIGGELTLPNQKIKIKPKPGLLVAFPSHHEFLHGAEPTESGIRYALVSWAAAKGGKRLRAVPYGSTFLSEFGLAA